MPPYWSHHQVAMLIAEVSTTISTTDTIWNSELEKTMFNQLTSLTKGYLYNSHSYKHSFKCCIRAWSRIPWWSTMAKFWINGELTKVTNLQELNKGVVPQHTAWPPEHPSKKNHTSNLKKTCLEFIASLKMVGGKLRLGEIYPDAETKSCQQTVIINSWNELLTC